MATSSSPPPSPPPPPPQSPPQYWCYHCDKRVLIESQPDDVICTECNFGFVESIPSAATTVTTVSNGAAILSPENVDEPTLGSQFLQVLRLLAQVSREGDATLPPQQSLQEQEPPLPNGSDPTVSDDSDFLRIEIDGWDEDNQIQDQDQNQIQNRRDNDEDEEDEDDDDDDDDVRSVEIEGHSDEEEEDLRRRRRRDVLRLRLRDFASRTRTDGRNRILDWAEILMGLEDNSIEFRFETTDRYIGNPGDYVDGAEYEALLQNLADAEGRRGAPPASKSAVDGLEVKTVNDEDFVCAICKDSVNCGGVVKEMPCGHGYHSDCIVPWLESRNSCPVCRFELPTDDDDYEEEKKKKFHGGSSSGNSV